MIYHKLNTKAIVPKFTNQNILKEDIVNLLKVCYANVAFSTFPYLIYSSSSEAVNNMNSGNCIALCMYLQKILREKMNIVSYLIPVTVPNMYQADGMLKISHVALAIPRSKTEVFIADIAFYFLEPILINFNKTHNEKIASINIHDSVIQMVESTNKKTSKKTDFNEFQSIPKNTYYCECNYVIDPNDKWSYFLRQIVNPDHTIGEFFLSVKNKPWITTTELDKQGVCRQHINMKIKYGANIKIKRYNEILHDGPITALTNSTIDMLNKLLWPYFGRDIRYFLNQYVL
jgi:hypothetical protein